MSTDRHRGRCYVKKRVGIRVVSYKLKGTNNCQKATRAQIRD